ncbi:MAG: type II toxin-antitoxin system mRNA interferase toxin, RelE/StbE family [Patescibacteria group bacterium]
MERPIDQIFLSLYFEKNFNILPERIQKLVRRKDQIFRTDAFHSSLRTHKLHGEFKNYWAYSINREYRVLFSFDNDHAVTYLNIGTHEIYK